MTVMAKDKPADRHAKKPMQLRIHQALREQLDRAVEKNASTITAEVSRAIREYLERIDLWPPPKQGGK